MRIRLTVLLSVLLSIATNQDTIAQPLDLAIFNGDSGHQLEPSSWDTTYTNFCLSYLPLSSHRPELGGNLERWVRLPDQQIDTSNPFDPIRNPEYPRIFNEGTQAVFTPPDAQGNTRFWFATNGIHTWDSTMRRVTRYPPAPLHAIVPPSTVDREGTQGHQRSLMLPVRDTPGVFRHLIAGYRDGTDLRGFGISGSSDRIYNYRVDANYDSSLAEPQNGDAGPGPHLSYSPDPIAPQAYSRAIAWEGDALPYDTSRQGAIDGYLPTVSRMLAIAHGNGRDWWVFALGGQSAPRAVAVFLLNDQGLSLHSLAPEGIPFTPSLNHYYHGGMNLELSHDGDQIALHGITGTNYRSTPFADYSRGGIALWDFDRCTGELSEATYIDVPYRLTGLDTLEFNVDPVIFRGGGIAFSPTDRYLYYSERSYLARYDLQATYIETSEELVWLPDSLVSLCYGPGYRGSLSNILRLTTTHTPNPIILSYGGASCRLLTAFDNLDAENVDDIDGGWDAFGTPCLNGNAFVSTRYQIYDFEGSPCDTLGIDGPTEGWYDPDWVVSAEESPTVVPELNSLVVYPSPAQANTYVYVDLPENHVSGVLVFTNVGGQVVSRHKVSPGQDLQVLSLEGLAAGIYLVSFLTDIDRYTGRFLVVGR